LTREDAELLLCPNNPQQSRVFANIGTTMLKIVTTPAKPNTQTNVARAGCQIKMMAPIPAPIRKMLTPRQICFPAGDKY